MIQESGVRSQESEFRIQNSGVGIQRSVFVLQSCSCSCSCSLSFSSFQRAQGRVPIVLVLVVGVVLDWGACQDERGMNEESHRLDTASTSHKRTRWLLAPGS